MNQDDSSRWLRLSALLDTALDLPPPQRAGFVTANTDDDTLREQLLRLIAADASAEADAFLVSPVPPPDAAQWQHWTDAYEPGSRRFGAYRLLRLLGRGGMAEVHLAERADGEYEHRVALKLLPHPTPGLIARFARERQIVARLEHPNIARLLDGGVGEAGVPYFAMEFVDGVPITQHVKSAALDARATVAMFLQVCDAVQTAHRQLIVHRDIKPANILVGASGTPKLLDFGIAKLLDATGGDTQVGARVFTPDYAAPEQIRGEPVTTATDVYSLGVVLYELLAGCKPYRLRRDETLAQSVIGVEPAAPSTSAGLDATRRRALRGDLDRIVLTALAKAPDRRYASVEAFGADLRRWLDGRPVHARGDAAGYRLRKFVARHRWSVAGAAIAVVVLVAATLVSLSQASRARDEAASARASQKFMLNVFTQAEAWNNAGKQPTALDLARDAMSRIDTELADQPLARFDMYMGLQRLFSVADDIRLSVVAAQRAVDAARQLPHADPARLQRAQTSLSYAQFYNGDYAGAAHTLASLAAEQPSDEIVRMGVAGLQTDMARVRGERDAHLALARRHMALVQTLQRNRKEARAAQWHELEALERMGDFRALLPKLEDYDAGGVALYAAESPPRNNDMLWLLTTTADVDAPAAALALVPRILTRTRHLFGESDYLVEAWLEGASIARAAGKSAQALAWLREAQPLVDAVHADPIERADIDVVFGLSLLDLGDAAAAGHLDAAKQIYQGIGGDADPRVLMLRAALAATHVDAQAPAEWRSVFAAQRERNLRELPETAAFFASAALAGHADAAEAIAMLRVAQARLDAQGRAVSAVAVDVHRCLALLLATQHDAHAQEVARQALALAVAVFDGDDVRLAALASELPLPATQTSASRLIEARDAAQALPRPGLAVVGRVDAALVRAEAAEAAKAATTPPAP